MILGKVTNTTISRNKVFKEIKEKFPTDWLLPVELYELAKKNGDEHFAKEIHEHLEEVKLNNPKVGHLIDDGLQLVDSETEVLKTKIGMESIIAFP